MLRMEAPTDELTGVPLPLCPNPQLPPCTGRGVMNYDRVADWHHPYYPRRSLDGEGLDGEGLRASRVQWVMYDDHHEDRGGYHAFYNGPKLPERGFDWFKTVVFASADYVPARGIDIHRASGPYERTLRTSERLRLLNSGMVRVGSYVRVKAYLLDYVGKNGLASAEEDTIDEFLRTSDIQRKQALGGILIRHASELVADPLRETYRTAKKERFLPHQRTRSAGNFICNLLTYKAEPGGEPDIDTIMALQAYLPAA